VPLYKLLKCPDKYKKALQQVSRHVAWVAVSRSARQLITSAICASSGDEDAFKCQCLLYMPTPCLFLHPAANDAACCVACPCCRCLAALWCAATAA
jgi:hypothetical protein